MPEDNTQIFASKYQTILPDKKAFAKLLDEKESEGMKMIEKEKEQTIVYQLRRRRLRNSKRLR